MMQVPRPTESESPVQAISRMPWSARRLAFLCSARKDPVPYSGPGGRAPLYEPQDGDERPDGYLFGLGRQICRDGSKPIRDMTPDELSVWQGPGRLGDMLVAEPWTCRWTAKEFDRETLAIGVFEAKTVVYLMHPSTAPPGAGPAPTSSGGGASTTAAAPLVADCQPGGRLIVRFRPSVDIRVDP
jgi:hypothetical protein